MLDNKVIHSRGAGFQIMANFSQSFARHRVDELLVASALNVAFLHKWNTYYAFP